MNVDAFYSDQPGQDPDYRWVSEFPDWDTDVRWAKERLEADVKPRSVASGERSVVIKIYPRGPESYCWARRDLSVLPNLYSEPTPRLIDDGVDLAPGDLPAGELDSR